MAPVGDAEEEEEKHAAAQPTGAALPQKELPETDDIAPVADSAAVSATAAAGGVLWSAAPSSRVSAIPNLQIGARLAQSHLPAVCEIPVASAASRPYRSYINIETRGAETSPLSQFSAPMLPQPLSNARATARDTGAILLPNPNVAALDMLDWRLPLIGPHESDAANKLVAYKRQQDGYSPADLLQSYGTINDQIRNMIERSMACVEQAGLHIVANIAFEAVSGASLPPNTTDENRRYLNCAAMRSRLFRTLIMDAYIAMTSPTKLREHVRFLKDTMPQLKSELKRAPNTRLIFCCFDSILERGGDDAQKLLRYLNPLIAHAVDTLLRVFTSNGLPPPSESDLQNLVQAALDWLFRLKREFPNIGIYFPASHAKMDTQYFYFEASGGSVPNDLVVLATCAGLWDVCRGSVVFPAYIITR